MKRQFRNSAIILASCLALSAGAFGCVEQKTSHYEGVHAFKVVATPLSGNYGTVNDPLKMPTAFDGVGAYKVKLQAWAVDINGNVLDGSVDPETGIARDAYNETVKLSVEPGKLSSETITFKNGVAEINDLAIRYAFGTARIWVEDTEVRPLNMDNPVCPNNKFTENGLGCEPSYASGTSQEFVFEPQTIRMIQYNPDRPDGSSPLLYEYGQIRGLPGHDLVVTNVVSTGFYITDKGDTDYNSIFIFTFSQPGRVAIGDRVCEVSGGIAEFTGMTQLQFPSWGIQNKEQSTAEDIDPAPEDGELGIESCIDRITGEARACTEEELEAKHALIDCSSTYFSKEELEKWTKEDKKAFGYVSPPEPYAITNPSFFSLENTANIEALESSVITVQNIRLSTEFIDCDDNGNLKIETGTAEATCRNTCTGNDRCTELSSLSSYDQWRGWTLDGNGELSVASSSLINGFDITSERWTYKGMNEAWGKHGCEMSADKKMMTCNACYEWKDPNTQRRMVRCPERHLLRLTGNLKQVLPGCSGANSNTECYASKFKKNSMIMKVIEPRFSTDLIFDEAFNYDAQVDFQECISDTRDDMCEKVCKNSSDVKACFTECINDPRVDTCLDACKISSEWCTCDAFEKSYRKQYPASWPALPSCASRVPVYH